MAPSGHPCAGKLDKGGRYALLGQLFVGILVDLGHRLDRRCIDRTRFDAHAVGFALGCRMARCDPDSLSYFLFGQVRRTLVPCACEFKLEA